MLLLLAKLRREAAAYKGRAGIPPQFQVWAASLEKRVPLQAGVEMQCAHTSGFPGEALLLCNVQMGGQSQVIAVFGYRCLCL